MLPALRSNSASGKGLSQSFGSTSDPTLPTIGSKRKLSSERLLAQAQKPFPQNVNRSRPSTPSEVVSRSARPSSKGQLLPLAHRPETPTRVDVPSPVRLGSATRLAPIGDPRRVPSMSSNDDLDAPAKRLTPIAASPIRSKDHESSVAEENSSATPSRRGARPPRPSSSSAVIHPANVSTVSLSAPSLAAEVGPSVASSTTNHASSPKKLMGPKEVSSEPPPPKPAVHNTLPEPRAAPAVPRLRPSSPIPQPTKREAPHAQNSPPAASGASAVPTAALPSEAIIHPPTGTPASTTRDDPRPSATPPAPAPATTTPAAATPSIKQTDKCAPNTTPTRAVLGDTSVIAPTEESARRLRAPCTKKEDRISVVARTSVEGGACNLVVNTVDRNYLATTYAAALGVRTAICTVASAMDSAAKALTSTVVAPTVRAACVEPTQFGSPNHDEAVANGVTDFGLGHRDDKAFAPPPTNSLPQPSLGLDNVPSRCVETSSPTPLPKASSPQAVGDSHRAASSGMTDAHDTINSVTTKEVSPPKDSPIEGPIELMPTTPDPPPVQEPSGGASPTHSNASSTPEDEAPSAPSEEEGEGAVVRSPSPSSAACGMVLVPHTITIEGADTPRGSTNDEIKLKSPSTKQVGSLRVASRGHTPTSPNALLVAFSDQIGGEIASSVSVSRTSSIAVSQDVEDVSPSIADGRGFEDNAPTYDVLSESKVDRAVTIYSDDDVQRFRERLADRIAFEEVVAGERAHLVLEMQQERHAIKMELVAVVLSSCLFDLAMRGKRALSELHLKQMLSLHEDAAVRTKVAYLASIAEGFMPESRCSSPMSQTRPSTAHAEQPPELTFLPRNCISTLRADELFERETILRAEYRRNMTTWVEKAYILFRVTYPQARSYRADGSADDVAAVTEVPPQSPAALTEAPRSKILARNPGKVAALRKLAGGEVNTITSPLASQLTTDRPRESTTLAQALQPLQSAPAKASSHPSTLPQVSAVLLDSSLPILSKMGQIRQLGASMKIDTVLPIEVFSSPGMFARTVTGLRVAKPIHTISPGLDAQEEGDEDNTTLSDDEGELAVLARLRLPRRPDGTVEDDDGTACEAFQSQLLMAVHHLRQERRLRQMKHDAAADKIAQRIALYRARKRANREGVWGTSRPLKAHEARSEPQTEYDVRDEIVYFFATLALDPSHPMRRSITFQQARAEARILFGDIAAQKPTAADAPTSRHTASSRDHAAKALALSETTNRAMLVSMMRGVFRNLYATYALASHQAFCRDLLDRAAERTVASVFAAM